MFCGTIVGIAGDVLAHVAREHPGIEIVAAAGGVADQQLDGLAAVEIGNRLGVARLHGQQQRHEHYTQTEQTSQPQIV